MVVHDILGTPVEMGRTATLHATQRVLDNLLRGTWLEEEVEEEEEDSVRAASAGGHAHSPVVTVPAAVRIYVQPMSPEDFRQHLDSVGLEPDWVSFQINDDGLVCIENLEFKGPTRLLHRYLLEAGWVEELSVTH